MSYEREKIREEEMKAKETLDIITRAAKDEDLLARDVRVLAAVGKYYCDGIVEVPVSKLVEELPCGRRSIYYALKKLIDAKFVARPQEGSGVVMLLIGNSWVISLCSFL